MRPNRLERNEATKPENKTKVWFTFPRAYNLSHRYVSVLIHQPPWVLLATDSPTDSPAVGFTLSPCPLTLEKKYRCSSTVRLSKSMLNWGQNPIDFRTPFMLVRMLQPLITASPHVGGMNPGEKRGESLAVCVTLS